MLLTVGGPFSFLLCDFFQPLGILLNPATPYSVPTLLFLSFVSFFSRSSPPEPFFFFPQQSGDPSRLPIRTVGKHQLLNPVPPGFPLRSFCFAFTPFLPFSFQGGVVTNVSHLFLVPILSLFPFLVKARPPRHGSTLNLIKGFLLLPITLSVFHRRFSGVVKFPRSAAFLLLLSSLSSSPLWIFDVVTLSSSSRLIRSFFFHFLNRSYPLDGISGF